MHTFLHPDRGPGRSALPGRPRADCTADSAGGLTFDVTGAARGDGWGAALLLRRRRGSGPGDPVRLPLFPAGDGRLRAALPSTMPLAEGRWDAFLAQPGAQPHRLQPGVCDLRPLVARVPGVHRTWLGVRIPYRTRQDNLTVRAWLRWPHAEVEQIACTARGLVVQGRLYGAVVGRGARLEVGSGPSAGESVRATVLARGGDASAFHCELTGGLPGAGRWLLRLRASRAAEPVRLARLLDDVADKRRLVPCPPLVRGGLIVTVGFTSANDLTLRAERTACAPPA